MKLIFGTRGPEVLEFKKKLVEAGAFIFVMDDVFGIELYVATKAFQENKGVTADGWATYGSGPTWEALVKAKAGEATPNPRPTVKIDAPVILAPGKILDPSEADAWGNALHIKNQFLPRNGWTEFSHDKQLAPYCWDHSGYGSKTVIGSDNAWCEGFQNGMWWAEYKQTSNSAMASSSKSVGIEADDYWFGSRVHLKHAGGGNHATEVLYCVDKAKQLYACAGGNQNNAANITIYNFSGNKNGHDQPSTPRWAKGIPKGRVMTEEQVKKLIKSAGIVVGGSTR